MKYYFYTRRDDGLDEVICEILRCQVRERPGRQEDPSLVVLDAQSVHAAVNVPASTTGKDAAKKVPGRKHGIAVDVAGLIIAVVVMAASVHDNAIGTALLNKVTANTGSVSKALVDQGFKNTMVAHGRELSIGALVQPEPWNDARSALVAATGCTLLYTITATTTQTATITDNRGNTAQATVTGSWP